MAAPQQADLQWIGAVARFADLALERCADTYGQTPTPLLVDAIDLTTGAPASWDGSILSNLAYQQNFLRVREGLAALTGRKQYQQLAEEWIGYGLEHLSDRASGMLYWGGHSSFDLRAGEPLVGNHELKCSYPHYRFLYQVNPQLARDCMEGFWHAHVCDWSTLLFNRHGEYVDWDRSSRWQGEYRGGPLPIIENMTLSFINTGSDLIFAAVQLHLLTGAAEPLEWAQRLLGRYEEIRHPDTGLAGYQFNHRDPCRVRIAFKPPLNQRADINETTVIKNGTIETRYGRAAITFLNLAAELGPEAGQVFVDLAVRDLTALAEHSYDRESRCFHAVLTDGTWLGPELTVDGVGYCPPFRLTPLPANGVMLLAYARAFRMSGDRRLLEMARELAASVMDNGADPAGPDDGACGLIGRLELYAATGEESELAAARTWGGRLLAAYPAEQLFTDGSGGAPIDGLLPVALLHLAAAGADARQQVPTFYATIANFDPKVVIDRRQNG
jgi:pectate lyase